MKKENTPKGRILVVDDHLSTMEYAIMNLMNRGYQIQTANNVERALDLIDGGFDIYLIDRNFDRRADSIIPALIEDWQAQYPRTYSGEQIIEEIVKRVKPKPIIIGVGGYEGIHADKIGMDGCIDKLAIPDELIPLIENIQSNRRVRG